MSTRIPTSAYRFPNEYPTLAGSLLLVLAVILVSATATLCTSVVFIAAFVYLGYAATRSHHRALLRGARQVTSEDTPALAALAQRCMQRIQPGDVEIYVAPSEQLNAYTFGLSTPRVVVMYSELFRIMDEDELCFILGHELGHVALGHTRLNSLLGGMAGIPSSSSATAVMSLAFLAWNRACEYSADRAGLLACGKPEKAITALIKIVAGPQALSRSGMELAYRQIDAQDDTLLGSLGEALGSHPMIIRRIEQIRSFAGSAAYRRLVQRG
jgi:Zn-dependent protease with chaperone function